MKRAVLFVTCHRRRPATDSFPTPSSRRCSTDPAPGEETELKLKPKRLIFSPTGTLADEIRNESWD